MSGFASRHPVWSLLIAALALLLVWLVFAVWPPGLEQAIGRKRVFVNALANGVTLGALYFLVASGFTLIFGLMRNVNLAHGSLYLIGGYVGYGIAAATGVWALALLGAFLFVAALGVALQVFIFRWLEGQDLRQTMVTIGLSIVLADLCLWFFGGDFYQVETPEALSGPVQLPVVVGTGRGGQPVYLTYPLVRLVILLGAVAVGVAMWLALNRTRIGMLVRAGVDDRDMLSATGVRVPVVFAAVFAFGAGLAGLAGVVGGTFQSLQPGGGHQDPAGLAGRRHRGRDGVHTGRGRRRADRRARGATRVRLHADLLRGADLRDHGGRPGAAPAGPGAEAVAGCRRRAPRAAPSPPGRNGPPGRTWCIRRPGPPPWACSSWLCRSSPAASSCNRSSPACSSWA
jgi:branched-chain amino acid transport system permease protein